MVALSDESLLAGLASGDPEAATAFVRRFQGRVYGLAFAVLGDAQAAEDAAQEALLKAWRHAAAYDPRRGSVPTWLLTIARNVSIDSARVRRADPIDPETLALYERAPDDRAEERLTLIDEIERVRKALEALPQEQRRALLLAAFFGRTAVEIGEQENIPVGTAKTRIRSGLVKVRAALEVSDER